MQEISAQTNHAKRPEIDQAIATGLSLIDINAMWNAHQEQPLSEANRGRRFDANVPYAVHPLWCANTLITEQNLSTEFRMRGAQALLYHDVLEDTSASLPIWLSPEVKQLIEDLTFYNGSPEERVQIWSRSPEARLLKLYDKVSNLLDGNWRSEDALESARAFLRELARDVDANYPGLNIVRMAAALAGPEWPELSVNVGDGPVRLSVANIIGRARIGGTQLYVGLLNPKNLAKGRKVFSAIGGGAHMTAEGKQALSQLFGAEFHEGDDARLIVAARRLKAILALFEEWPPTVCEASPQRELEEELCGSELMNFGIGPVLTCQELQEIHWNYIGTVRQPVAATQGTSAREHSQIPSRRIFNMFELDLSEALFNKMREHSAVRFFTGQNLRELDADRKLRDGTIVSDNIMII